MADPGTFLDKIGVASPCAESWDAMQGDDRVRYCGSCRLSVYNLSAMSRREAADLVRSREGRLCVKFLRRADGTLVTDECGRVRRALRRKALVVRAAAAAFVGLVLSPLLAACGAGARPAPGGEGPQTVGTPAAVQPGSPETAPLLPTPRPVESGTPPVEMLGRVAAPAAGPEEPVELMGDVCIPEELAQPDPPAPTGK